MTMTMVKSAGRACVAEAAAATTALRRPAHFFNAAVLPPPPVASSSALAFLSDGASSSRSSRLCRLLVGGGKGGQQRCTAAAQENGEFNGNVGVVGGGGQQLPVTLSSSSSSSLRRLPLQLRSARTSFSSSLRTSLLLQPSSLRLGSNFEDYYGMVEYATKIQSPMVMYMWWGWAIAQVAICAGALFHSNYYFSGRILPKTQGNTQLCEDSW